MFSFKTDKLDPNGVLYKLFLPVTPTGSNKVYFDLFNGSDQAIEIASITPIVSGAVAVTGVVAADLFLTRTTEIGTGGTEATFEGTALNAATFSRLDPDSPLLRAGITARFTPAGGATAGAVLAFNSQFTEETNVACYFRNNLAQVGPAANDGKLTVRPGTGIRVVQGPVASVGNIGFDILLQVMDN
jgi:hypothetical protein